MHSGPCGAEVRMHCRSSKERRRTAGGVMKQGLLALAVVGLTSGVFHSGAQAEATNDQLVRALNALNTRLASLENEVRLSRQETETARAEARAAKRGAAGPVGPSNAGPAPVSSYAADPPPLPYAEPPRPLAF